jgi:hypothetical protein
VLSNEDTARKLPLVVGGACVLALLINKLTSGGVGRG